jgi:mono/diheme cytochrome c family protein
MIEHNTLWKSITIRVLTAFVLLVSFLPTYAADAVKGQKLFKGNCTSCHSIGANKVVGPGLKGVEDRWKDKALLHKWIKNNTEVLKSGDAYANALFAEYNKSTMTLFPQLSDEDIDNMLEYIKNPPADAAKPVDVTTSTGGGAAKANDQTTYILLGALIALFLFLMSILSSIRRSLAKLASEKLGTEEEPELGGVESVRYWINNHKKTVAVLILVLVSYGATISWYSLKEIGVFTGYMPEQPIKYSHKLHAGKNAINCQYCHFSAYKGKVAGVPSVSLCMNCHKYIQEGPVYGKTEIAKIYAALDFNPEKQTYGPNQKPVKWVRVHNLPDHVYFNHSQHVVAGKVECQKCHGPIQEMDTVRQFSELTMRWCVDCHRETEVKMEGNNYYTELHSKLKTMYKGQKITVAKMGGIECGKCHY